MCVCILEVFRYDLVHKLFTFAKEINGLDEVCRLIEVDLTKVMILCLIVLLPVLFQSSRSSLVPPVK